MKTKDLRPNAENPRIITDGKKRQLKKTMLRFGDLSGIVYNRKTQQLVGGHQRNEQFGPDAVVTYTRKFKNPTRTGTVAEGYIEFKGARFSYREVFWDIRTEKAANLAANKNAGEFDLAKVGEWVKELSSFDVDFDLDLTMFDANELTQFGTHTVGEHERTNSKTGVDEDAVPEVVPPKTKLGDLYLLGDHRLLCGDSTRETVVAKLMNGKKADMVFTDPPYGMNLDTDYSKLPSTKESGNKSYRPVAGDGADFKPELIKTIFWNFEKTEEVFIFGADYFAELIPNKNEGSWVVWDKRVEEHFDRMFGSAFELCWSKNKHKREIARFNNTLFGGDVEARGKVHPTQKPTRLIEWFFERWGEGLVSVVDLFGGSGSTMIACEKTNRKCYMMELDPHYCDVIVARWEAYTGLKGKLVRTETKTKQAVKQVGKQERDKAKETTH